MKKAITLFLGLTLLLCSACGGKVPAEFVPDSLCAALLDAGVFSEELEPLDADFASLLYGVEETHLTACAIYGSTGATAEELAVLVLDSADAASQALDGLKARVEDQKFALENYLPREIPKLDGAILERRGNSVLLIVANDAKAAGAVIDGLGK